MLYIGDVRNHEYGLAIPYPGSSGQQVYRFVGR